MRRLATCVLVLAATAVAPAWGAEKAKGAEKPKAPPKNALSDDLIKKITDAMPEKASAAPAKPRKLLVFNLAKGFKHGSIPIASKTFEIMGQKTGAFTVTATDNVNIFEPEKLKECDAVMMNNTTGEIFGPAPKPNQKPTPEQEKAAALCKSLVDFVAGGKGVCGIHSATDWVGWGEYGKLMGAQFGGHPYRRIVCKNEDPTNPINAAFEGKEFEISDEMYIVRESYTRKDLRVLLSIDVAKSNITKQARKDQDYWVSWVRPYGKGRVFYCSLGHETNIFFNGKVLQHYLAGIQYALGDQKADDAPKGEVKLAEQKAGMDGQLDPLMGAKVYLTADKAAEPKKTAAKKAAPAKPAAVPQAPLPAAGPDGFVALLNGKDLTGWMSAGGGVPGSGWTIDGGAATLDKSKGRGGDLWTQHRFGDFVLDLEFKTDGNSGIFIRTDKPTDNVQTGIEIQVDRPTKTPNKHSVGAMYDALAPTKDPTKPNDWNRAVITCNKNKLTVEINGEKVLEADLDKWSEPGKNPDGSNNKFRTALKDFKREGHIGLQDHGAKVAYRNIKIKPN